MTQLKGKISIVLLVTILIGCMEESDKHKLKIGTYANKNGNEEIVFLDSVNYLHRYSLNGIEISDTATYEFYSYSAEGIGSIELSEFKITDSVLYPEIRRREDGIYTLAYIPEYRYPIWSSSQRVIRSDLDDFQTILYFQED